MWPLRTIFYFVLFWAGCLTALVNPIWGVVTYLMVYHTHPAVKWWGIPLVQVHGLRFSLLAVGFTIIGLWTGRKNVPRTRPILSLWELGVLGLLALAFINLLLGAAYGPGAQYALEKFWKLQVFVFILARLATTRRNLKLVIWALVGGSFYLGYDAFTAPGHMFLLGRLENFGGPDTTTSSGASAHLAALLPIVGIAFLAARQWRWKLAAAVAGALSFNAIVLCRTRSAFVGLIAGAAAAVLMAPRAKRYRIHLLLVLGGVLAFALTDTHYWERMTTLTSKQRVTADEAIMTRWDIWKASGRILADHPMGVGLGNFAAVIGDYDERYERRSPHNTVIMAFCELGILGGLLFLALCLGSVRLLFRCSKLAALTDNPLETKLMAYGLLVSLVTYFVAGLGTERFSCESFWWILVLPLCLHRMVTREAAARAEVPELAQAAAAPVDYPIWGSLQHGP